MSQKRLRNKCQKKTREAHYYSIPHIAQFSMRNFSVLLGLLVDPLKKIRFIRILHIFTLMNLGLWFRIEIRAPIWICELAIVEINLTSHSICNQGKTWNPKSFFFPFQFSSIAQPNTRGNEGRKSSFMPANSTGTLQVSCDELVKLHNFINWNIYCT